jgi:hypothetical protein
MKIVARRFLIIYSTFKKIEEIQINGNYVRYFLKWMRNNSEFDEKIKLVLNNIEDIKKIQ